MVVAVYGAAGSIGSRHVDYVIAAGHDVIMYDTAWCPNVHPGRNDAGAVIIATPADAHLDLVEQCLDARVPVYCEKPLATMAELPRAIALAALAKTRGVRTRVGYNWRYRENLPPTISESVVVACWGDMSTWPGAAGRGELVPEYSHVIDLVRMYGATTLGKVRWHDEKHVEFEGTRRGGGRWHALINDGVQPHVSVAVGHHARAFDLDPAVVHESERRSVRSFLDGNPGPDLHDGVMALAWSKTITAARPEAR